MQKILNYINGELVEPTSKKYMDNFDPSTGAVYSLCPDSDEKDVELAVKSAEAAFDSWSNLPNEKRSRIMVRISELIEKNLERLAIAESTDNGKPVSLARIVDIPRAASNFHFYATAILHYASECHAMEDTAQCLSHIVYMPTRGLVGKWRQQHAAREGSPKRGEWRAKS